MERNKLGTPTIPIDKSRYVSDGFGSVWPPCPVCNSRMMVVRPGEAVCPRESEHEIPYDRIDGREKVTNDS